MKFELTRKQTAGHKRGEVESIGIFDDFKACENAMIEYANDNMSNGVEVDSEGGVTPGGWGAPSYHIKTGVIDEEWGLGDYDGMDCGDYDLWIKRVE